MLDKNENGECEVSTEWQVGDRIEVDMEEPDISLPNGLYEVVEVDKKTNTARFELIKEEIMDTRLLEEEAVQWRRSNWCHSEFWRSPLRASAYLRVMKRWSLLPRNNWFNMYINKIEKPDGTAFHSHPYNFIAFTLNGRGREEFTEEADRAVIERDFSFYRRYQIKNRHRISEVCSKSIWTLMIHFRRKVI